jgi:dTDP-4-amino-4,6-dideoxygalactose transaminase
LKKAGIGAARTYPETMDVQPPVAATGAILHGDLRVSKAFCESVVNLPLFYGIRDDEREASAAALLAAL